MTDALTEESSQEASVFDETELIGSPNTDVVAAQLASAGRFNSHIFFHLFSLFLVGYYHLGSQSICGYFRLSFQCYSGPGFLVSY